MDIAKMNQIDKVLRDYPAKISEHADDQDERRFLLDTEKLKLKQIEARKHLSFKAERPDATTPDLKAMVDEDDEVYAQRMAVIEFESAYRKAGIKVERYVNGFTAARKSASLEIEVARSMNDTVRGGQKEER